METYVQGETSNGTPASHQNLMIKSVLRQAVQSTMCCVLQRHVDTPSLGILQFSPWFSDAAIWYESLWNIMKYYEPIKPIKRSYR